MSALFDHQSGCGLHLAPERIKKESLMSASPSFTRLADETEIADTISALEGRGFTAEVVDDLDAARATVLARMPQGSLVMTQTSATLKEAGIAAAVEESGVYESARKLTAGLDFRTQLQEMKTIAGQPDFALGSVHAITHDGVLFVASATGSQLATFVWGAAKVIFVVGTQKLVPDDETARQRIYEHSLGLEEARMQQESGRPSYVGKLLEIRQEAPQRIHLVLIRQLTGF